MHLDPVHAVNPVYPGGNDKDVVLVGVVTAKFLENVLVINAASHADSNCGGFVNFLVNNQGSGHFLVAAVGYAVVTQSLEEISRIANLRKTLPGGSD